ncbi:hypothetical protein NU195Hw_g1615t1 [Hortaea werneckii]
MASCWSKARGKRKRQQISKVKEAGFTHQSQHGSSTIKCLARNELGLRQKLQAQVLTCESTISYCRLNLALSCTRQRTLEERS